MRRLRWTWIIRILGVWLTLGSVGFTESRGPHVAGQFYPADRQELLALIQELLSHLSPPGTAQYPRALIAPHAGYQYSGPVAASAFRLVQGHRYDGVAVIGFTHRLAFDGVSVDTRDSYETPLGRIPVDREAVAFLLDRHPSAVRHHEEAHAATEHSLEVMLPFLQVALGEFRLVPLLMGQVQLADADRLAEALAALSQRGDYLFVFSTDLSHYHPDDVARRIDRGTIEAILFETPQAVHRRFTSQHLEACGRWPIVTSLFLAARLGYLRKTLVRYANSGETAGDSTRVVGYAAVAMDDRPSQTVGRLSDEAGMALVRAARESLERALIHGEEPQPIALEPYPELAQASGVFVTLRKQGLLCGCIGRIETDEPLATTVPLVALEAALRDARFEPVRGEDLDEIRVEVSVLTPLTRLDDLGDLVPGRDGVVLERQGRRGVFLPSVWESTGWTRLEFLRELASQKAGMMPEAWRDATLSVFQDQVFEEPAESPAEEPADPLIAH